MAYTIKTTASDLHRFPTLATRDEAAQWARNQAKADLMSFGITVGCDGRIESEYTDEGENAAYVFIKNATTDMSSRDRRNAIINGVWPHSSTAFTPRCISIMSNANDKLLSNAEKI